MSNFTLLNLSPACPPPPSVRPPGPTGSTRCRVAKLISCGDALDGGLAAYLQKIKGSHSPIWGCVYIDGLTNVPATVPAGERRSTAHVPKDASLRAGSVNPSKRQRSTGAAF